MVYELSRGHIAQIWTNIRFNSNFKQDTHNLPGELIISLTSYPPRYSTLLPTLKCLLFQDAKPDRVILWIAHDDMDALPEHIKALESCGLEIRATENLRVYTKLIPALKAFPDAFIVTADDDIYYPSDWLKKLINCWDAEASKIICHRAHVITLDENNQPRPYNDWKWEIKSVKDDDRIFPTGVGGVLYPPNALLLPEAVNEELFQKLAPGADDLWLYWMGRKNGIQYKVSGHYSNNIVWPGSQEFSLGASNTGKFTGVSGNDEKIKNLIEYYGFP